MRFPRRTFLSRLAAWGGAGAILPTMLPGGKAVGSRRRVAPGAGAGIETALGTAGRPLDRTCAEVFERQVGTRFRIVDGPGSAPRSVRLATVTRSRTIAQPGRRAPEPTPAFSLIFHGPSGPALPQDTYRVEHPQLGAFPLFLVPIGPDRDDARYQAIFA